jgi:protein phosphatase PTC2/3
MVGCDGIFDKMSTEDVIKEVWKPLQQREGPLSIPGQGTVNEVCGYSAERVIRACMIKESLDNLSVIIIAFKNFSKYIEKLAATI